MKKLNPTNNAKPVPDNLKPSRDQANKFNKHFVSIASSIIDKNQLVNPDLKQVENVVNTRKPSTSNFEIPLLDTNTLDKLIRSLPTNVATGLDGISAPLLKLISPAILESLTKVLNCSIQSGICPSALKRARVTPVHKSGSASDPNNFRRISVLPIISKLHERHICTQLMLYLRSFNLIVSTQSGFRPHHSTESVLIKMTDDWLEAMDQGLYTGAIFLDLSNAFDVVNHDLLTAKLQIYGCSPSSLLWFKSYLTDRRQCVNLTDTVSIPQEWCNDTKRRLRDSKQCMKTDYSVHCKLNESTWAHHSRKFALSDGCDPDFQAVCTVHRLKAVLDEVDAEIQGSSWNP